MVEMSSYINDIQKSLRSLDLSSLEGNNILITGATGLIGSSLVDVLMNIGCSVYAHGRNEERAKKRFSNYWNTNRFFFIKGDITKPLDSNVNFDYIIHAASNASPNFFKEKPVEVITSNIIGTHHLIEYGLTHGLKRMLFVSSGEVYGEGTGKAFVETDSGYIDCATTRACYPSSKRAAETLCVSYADEYGADIVIARPCHTYGPFFTKSDNRVYAQFIRNVLNDEDIVMKSTGEQFRSWCYVVDCVSALLHILLKGESVQAYNIADENSNISIRELAEIIAEIGGRRVIIDIPKENEKKGFNPVTKSVFSIEKIESLGWRVKGRMVDKLCHTIEERMR